MRAVIDASKGAYFRCLAENGDLLTVHRSMLPEGVGEGDVLKVTFALDTEATKRQKELMASRKG
ncbi:MAG TPA: DUF3006 domain-containing protein [Candidatus Ozemobacteraceae bacterium]|nr:DUF3006 domain-containing protein [Candidatus Ozemobacteraceae bacterium]